MADWLAHLHRRTSGDDASSSSSLEPTFRINNPRNRGRRGRRVTSGGSIIRPPRRNVLSGDLSLSSEELPVEYPVLSGWNAGAHGAYSAREIREEACVILIDQAERRLVEPVTHFDELEKPGNRHPKDLDGIISRNTETVNRMCDDEWLLR